MKITNIGDKKQASFYVATELYKQMIHKKESKLGLATGGTMIEMYEALVSLLEKNQPDVSQVETFNLDEYIGLDAEHPASYHQYMNNILFDQYKGFDSAKCHLPNGVADNPEVEANRYEALLDEKGPMDLQILGIGQNGHIGFNEPGTAFDSVTHRVDLTDSTIEANSRYFDDKADVPKQAISMGLRSIMKAKRIILLAFGEHKKEAITQLASGNITTDVPATILHLHPNVEVYVDDAAMPD
ncbi:glucosamine-6-phosphate deaminase [Staphylococcus muscae]|uniref:Glucosamine-6-phosphate deaminase n=1 Tax=Staphylococcus muscae TaxID=1294 RepID=A0A240BV03_9STAP|nr:glucosamine-6-phosphate deaminase [Staphylococcus muscae]AVQ34169.1 glucosamine-6-phosphate deaminase [Staphylococcus muscae]PNZ03480.1 glucosamine-6-phosphate deaminase [Staphylococcus muscae]GGA85566.1 glucosamine-6-phosphate deaminase [Staphylococcus muscae]SNV99192.1 glucosamine-6-phosphate isomerase [Staphylococcus muscae]